MCLVVSTNESQLATLIKNHVDKLKSFGNGTCTEQELFVSVMKTLTALGSPIPIQWKDKPWPKAEYKDDVKHPLGSLYHFRHPVLPCGKLWSHDVLVSGLQKAIRRSNVDDAMWIVSQLLTFAEFYEEVSGLKCIHSGAQGKVTNMLNRLLVISVEDIVPNPKLFNEIYISIEETRKRLKALKEAQTSELYDTNISFMAMNLFNVVSVLCASPKARVISSRNVTFAHHYKKAEASLPIPDKKENQEVLKK